jgi:hypothetical protein
MVGGLNRLLNWFKKQFYTAFKTVGSGKGDDIGGSRRPM